MSALPEMLERALIPEPVLKVLARLGERGFQAFLVGGCVRDLLRGVEPKDFDVATSARPPDVQRSFARVIPTGIQHGTVTVLSDGARVEVTTFRTEGRYEDGRRPASVEFKEDVKEDLSRRDFTINAMAFSPIERLLVDPFGGQHDLARRLIRCVGDARARFGEDGLRPLRAVRFAAVLGFEIDPATEEAIPPTLPVFKKVAIERVREELQKLLLGDRASEGLELLDRTGLLGAILPELCDLRGVQQDARYDADAWGHTLATVAQTPPSLELRLAALLHDVGKPRSAVPSPGGNDFPEHEVLGEQMARTLMERLKLPNRTIDQVALLVRHHRLSPIAAASDVGLRRFVARVGEANLESLLRLAEANARAYGPGRDASVEQVLELEVRLQRLLAQRPPLTPRQLALDGNAIMRALGVGPSALVGDATRFLFDLVLENPELNSPDRLTESLRKWAKEKGL